jgi:cytochrome c5
MGERIMKHVLNSVIVGTTLMIAAHAFAADGQAVYTANCGGCHNLLKPKLGDKDAWAPLIKLGEDALVTAVIKGKGAMPARAGKTALSDNDIKAAVEYMESKAQ